MASRLRTTIDNPIDNLNPAPQAIEEVQEPQDINRESRIPRPQRSRTRSRTGSLPPRSHTRNEQHLPAVPDTDQTRGNNTCPNKPRLQIPQIGGSVHGVTPDVMGLTCCELNEQIFTRLNRLYAELPIDVESVEDLVTGLEQLKFSQKSHEPEIELTISAVSAPTLMSIIFWKQYQPKSQTCKDKQLFDS